MSHDGDGEGYQLVTLTRAEYAKEVEDFDQLHEIGKSLAELVGWDTGNGLVLRYEDKSATLLVWQIGPHPADVFASLVDEIRGWRETRVVGVSFFGEGYMTMVDKDCDKPLPDSNVRVDSKLVYTMDSERQVLASCERNMEWTTHTAKEGNTLQGNIPERLARFLEEVQEGKA